MTLKLGFGLRSLVFGLCLLLVVHSPLFVLGTLTIDVHSYQLTTDH